MNELLGKSLVEYLVDYNKKEADYIIEELKMCVDLYDLADTLEWLNLCSNIVSVNKDYSIHFYKYEGNKLERHYIFNLNDLSLVQLWDNGNDIIGWYKDGVFVE